MYKISCVILIYYNCGKYWSSKVSVAQANVTIGILASVPHNMNRKYVTSVTPLSRRIRSHINPANAPFNAKLAPKLLPITRTNMLAWSSAAVTLQANVGWRRTLVKRMVMGWLFRSTQLSAETKPMANTAEATPLFATSVLRTFAKRFNQPVTSNASTMIN